MITKINKEKHFKDQADALTEAFDRLEKLYNESSSELKEVIDIACGWFEQNNLLYYSFFHNAFDTSTALNYYSGLGSFLENTILDDSYYKIVWSKYNNKLGCMEPIGTPWEDEPSVTWDYTDDGLSDASLFLKVMKFAIERERKLDEWRKKIDEMLGDE